MLHTPSSLRGMVTSPHHLASQSGLDILKEGGSVIEAAIATAATLAVVYPHMNSIGGDSFWLIREPDGRVHSINACGAAALAADADLYKGLDTIPWRGPLAANTVAGTISGWQVLLEQDRQAGSQGLPLARILRDAVHYADHGVVVTRGGADIAGLKDAELKDVPGYAAVFRPMGRPLEDGDRLKQPALAETFRRLINKGLADFYSGGIASDLSSDLAAFGSPVGAVDLLSHRASQPVPLSTRIKGAHLYNSAPPTQGAASLMILALFDRLGVKTVDDFDFVHGLVEATKRAFVIRDDHIGDPAYMSLDLSAMLSDRDTLDALAARIDPRRALPWPQEPVGGDTVWFGAIDDKGRAVSAIQSTYFEFGSGLVLPNTGVIWQNRGASFQLKSQGPRALKPGRLPFHTLNPALAVFDDGRVMAYGTMGGEGQPQTQAAVFSRYRAGLGLQAAVSAPRWLLGKTWGDDSVTLKLEDRFAASLREALSEAGHRLEILPAFTSVMGHAGALVYHQNGRLEGATDPRSDGSVAAW